MTASKKDQVVAHFKAEIEAGRLRPGDPIPSKKEMRNMFGMSDTPIREAVHELKLLGYLRGVPRDRVYVAERSVESDR